MQTFKTEDKVTISAQWIYTGFSDYWSGDGERWEDNKGCLFTYYGRETTYQNLIDGWVEDWNAGGDFDDNTLAEHVTEEMLRKALREIFVHDMDVDEVIVSATCLDEDHDENNDESPQCIILVQIVNED